MGFEPGYAFIADELATEDADAFVVIADGADPTMRYLTRFVGPDRPYAFVFVSGSAMLCAPALFVSQADREFAGDTVYGPDAFEVTTPAERAVAVLQAHDVTDGARVLMPPDSPHDSALRLEGAGYELASTSVVPAERALKAPAEIAAIRTTAGAAEAGLAAAATTLDQARSTASRLSVDGERLTTGRLRRRIDAAMAEAGASDAGNTVVGAGPSAADCHFQGDVPIDPGEPVVVDVSPRGRAGYHADCTRTYLPAGTPGWTRRAHVAVRSALEAALESVEPGVSGDTVHREAAAELRAHGFRIDRGGDTGFIHGVGHGIGLALHERPALPSETPLEPGHVVTIEPGVYDPSEGGVRLEELVVVTETGHEILTDLPLDLQPGVHPSGA